MTDAPLTRRALRDARARRRTSGLLGSTLLTALVVAAGVSGVGGTYALLSAQGDVSGATVTAASVGLNVNGAASADLGDWAISPATPVAKAFSVTNTAPTGPAASVSPVRVNLQAAISVTASSAITANTTAVITPVASAAACTTGLGSPSVLSGYSTTLDVIAPGQTKFYCLQLGLATGTPVAQSGLDTGFTVTLTSTQLAN